MPPARLATIAVVPALIMAAVIVAAPGPAAARTYTCDGLEATIVGTRGNDIIYGTEGDDVIVALGGNDIIFAVGGDNVICAGPGDDVVFGGPGNDRIFGQGGNDFLYGGPGDDVIRGGPGDDVIEGGPGANRLVGNAGNDELWGTWCSPPASMRHFCRWPNLAAGQGEYGDLLNGTRLLGIGSTGLDVRQLQQLLDALGFEPGAVDGVFGAMTSSAVRGFQESRGIGADGVVGAATRAALADAVGPGDGLDLPDDWVLGRAGLLRSGSRGEGVAVLQRLLAGLGYDPGPADGVFGTKTTAAVRAFQSASGLKVDGAAGNTTKRALFGDFGDRKVLRGGPGFDTCNGASRRIGCESHRGLRPGAPRDPAAAEEWRPLVTGVFTEWGLEAEIDRAVAIVACESLADPMITTPAGGSGYFWIGLFQHTDRYWDARAKRAGIPKASPYDPRANAIVAALLVRESIDGGHSRGPWGHFGCGKILGYWP